MSHKLKFEDLSFISFAIMSLSILLSLVSLLRGISTLCESSYEVSNPNNERDQTNNHRLPKLY